MQQVNTYHLLNCSPSGAIPSVKESGFGVGFVLRLWGLRIMVEGLGFGLGVLNFRMGKQASGSPSLWGSRRAQETPVAWLEPVVALRDQYNGNTKLRQAMAYQWNTHRKQETVREGRRFFL